MDKKKKLLFILVCITQMIAIGFLLWRIGVQTDNFTQFARRISVIPRSKDSLIFPLTSTLQYYYEPKPFSTTTYDLAFLGMNKKVIQTMNADGLNERYEYPKEKADGVYRIIALGDSFTEGALVETKDNWPEQLEDMLNTSMQCPDIAQFEVINLGVAGYDMQYSLERFKRKGLQYHPDLVLLLIGQDDFDFPNELLRGKVQRFDTEFKTSLSRLRALQATGDMYPSYTLAYKELMQGKGDDVAERNMNQEFGYLNELMNIVPGSLIITPYNQLPATISTSIAVFIALHPNTTYIPYAGDYERFADEHPTPEGHTYLANLFLKSMVNLRSIPCVQKSQE